MSHRSSACSLWPPRPLLPTITTFDPLHPPRALRAHCKLRVSHNNQTGRFVVPFRPVWSPCGGSLLVGDMKRCVVAFDAARGSKLGSLNGEGLTAVPSRLATHPAGLPMIAGATNSGRVHIWR